MTIAEIEDLRGRVAEMQSALDSVLKYGRLQHSEDSYEVCRDWCPLCKVQAALSAPEAST